LLAVQETKSARAAGGLGSSAIHGAFHGNPIILSAGGGPATRCIAIHYLDCKRPAQVRAKVELKWLAISDQLQRSWYAASAIASNEEHDSWINLVCCRWR
jgi:hypothetical protein